MLVKAGNVKTTELSNLDLFSQSWRAWEKHDSMRIWRDSKEISLHPKIFNAIQEQTNQPTNSQTDSDLDKSNLPPKNNKAAFLRYHFNAGGNAWDDAVALVGPKTKHDTARLK